MTFENYPVGQVVRRILDRDAPDAWKDDELWAIMEAVARRVTNDSDELLTEYGDPQMVSRMQRAARLINEIESCYNP